MTAFADAICERDLVAGDREPDLIHAPMLDHPSASSRHLQKAECGVYGRPLEMAGHIDDVTCPRCLRVLEVREDLTV